MNTVNVCILASAHNDANLVLPTKSGQFLPQFIYRFPSCAVAQGEEWTSQDDRTHLETILGIIFYVKCGTVASHIRLL